MVNLSDASIRKRRQYGLSNFESCCAAMLADGVKDPVIVMLIHEPGDLANQGLDPYIFEEVVVTSSLVLKAAVEERALPRDKGGWGMDPLYMAHRMEQDVESCRGFHQGPITDMGLRGL